MSKSAQRPPGSTSLLERAGAGVTEVLLLCLAFLAAQALLLLLLLVGALPVVDDVPAPWAAIIAGPIVIGTAGLTYLGFERLLARSGTPPKPLAMPKGWERAGLGRGLVIAIAAIPVATLGASLVGLVQNLVFGIEIEEQAAIVELVERGVPFELTLLAVSAVILAPITEELLFRHMFFRRLRERAGPLAAWTLPAVAFAVAHDNFVGLAVYAWLASVFALAYLLSGRLWVAMLVHAGHNSIALLMLLYAPEALP